MKRKLPLLISIVFLLVGLFYFLEPFLSGWVEIVDPIIARNIFVPIDWIILMVTLPLYQLSSQLALVTPDIVFGLMFLLYVFYYLRVICNQKRENLKRLTIVPIIVCCLLWGIMLPLGWTCTSRRINAFRVGGWTRVMWSGGPSRVRTEALEFMQATTQAAPLKSEWPLSLQRLGYWLRIEHDNQLVLVGIGRVIGMADEFGFVLQDPEAPPPQSHYFRLDPPPRLSRLADGVYFFQQ